MFELKNICFKNISFKLTNQFVYILIYVCFLINVTNGAPKSSCSAVNTVFTTRGFTLSDIVVDPVHDASLRYCEVPSDTGSCCSFNMETRLAAASRLQLEKQTKDSIGKLASVLGTRAQKFNDYFKELLADSKKQFHVMFKRTYGIIYEQNSYVFSDLFDELEGYYLRGKVDLAEALDLFFNVLYQKMFTVLNAQYTFDDKYLGCVSENMKNLRPFGDVPDKLSVQIKRSFVATRTYAQALSSAADAVKNLNAIKPSVECTNALTRMQQCGLCSMHTEKPCGNYCVNVMKGCLQPFHEIDEEWDNFVIWMDKISERLLGPFNIVMVVEPINIKISEAIMNFQETGADISLQVFTGCGKPELGRRRRSTNDLDQFTFDDDNENIQNHERTKRSDDATHDTSTNREISYEPLQFSNTDDFSDTNSNSNKNNNKRKKNKNKKQDDVNKSDSAEEEDEVNKEPELDKLVKDIRQKVKDSKKFFSNLPYQFCNHEDLVSTPDNELQCWNGKTIEKYKHAVATNQLPNPEFPTVLQTSAATTRQKGIVADQLFVLKTAVNHLRNAYNGMDVEWSDQEDTTYGSGSGDGSDLEDDEDFNEFGSGSPYDIDSGKRPEITDNGIVPDVKHVDTTHKNSTGNAVDSNEIPDASDASRLPQEMSFRRALITYMFPIVMAWFGGMFSDLL